MKTIFLDSAYRCHLQNDGTMTAIQTDNFDGKCAAFIEGHRYVPSGQCQMQSDGVMICSAGTIEPWKPHRELAAAQAQYERDMAEADAAYQEGVNSAYDQ